MDLPFLHRPRWMRGESLPTPVRAPVIHTPRLVLRPYRLEDASAWLRVESERTIRENLHWPVRDSRQSLAHLRDRTRNTVLWQSGDFLALAVERDGEVIGDISMHLRTVAPETRSAELGWLQLSAFCGHGYATEAAAGMLGFAFDVVGTRLVTAVIDVDNHRSIALAERLGFVKIAQTGETVTFLTTSPPVGASFIVADASAGDQGHRRRHGDAGTPTVSGTLKTEQHEKVGCL